MGRGIKINECNVWLFDRGINLVHVYNVKFNFWNKVIVSL